MSVGSALLIGELVTSLAVQAVAAKTMFIAPNGIRSSTRFVASCFVTCGLTQALVLSLIAISTGEAAIGSLLYICGLGLFVATCRANRPRLLSVAFSEDVPQHLVVWGPYKYIRHPYYASYCVTWLAGAAASRNPIMAGTFLLMLTIYMWAARFEERKFLKSCYAAAYNRYRTTTGMLIPYLWTRLPLSAKLLHQRGSASIDIRF